MKRSQHSYPHQTTLIVPKHYVKHSGGELETIFERDYCCAWRHGIWKYWIRQHTKFGKIPILLYILTYQILINIRSWRNGFPTNFTSFIMGTRYVVLTEYYYVIKIATVYKILNVQSQSWSLLEFVKITTSELANESENDQDYPHQRFS